MRLQKYMSVLMNYVSKDVSDLETFMDYFALPERNCEKNFCFPTQRAVIECHHDTYGSPTCLWRPQQWQHCNLR